MHRDHLIGDLFRRPDQRIAARPARISPALKLHDIRFDRAVMRFFHALVECHGVRVGVLLGVESVVLVASASVSRHTTCVVVSTPTSRPASVA